MITIWKTLTGLQKIITIVLALATIGAAAMVVYQGLNLDWGESLAWATVLLGVVLTWIDCGAVEYFRHQERLAGTSWLLRVFTRTAITVTLVCAYLTAARAVTLILGQVWILTVLTGLVIIWLMVIPLLMQREFEDHEGL